MEIQKETSIKAEWGAITITKNGDTTIAVEFTDKDTGKRIGGGYVVGKKDGSLAYNDKEVNVEMDDFMKDTILKMIDNALAILAFTLNSGVDWP